MNNQIQQFLDLLLFCVTGSVFLLNQGNKASSLSGSRKSQQQQQKHSEKGSFYKDTTNHTTLLEALRLGTTLNATENVCTVDENNIPTSKGHVRSEMRLKKMWHRATYIVVRHKEEKEVIDNEDDHKSYILVQRRSNIKDYCPGKLDPAPGGVVGYGESYEENSVREMMEEMNINVDHQSNSIQKLFTFPYEDDMVRVWGRMFEVIYHGPMSDVKMQPEEVAEILRLSIHDIKRMAVEGPHDWMPDGLYAIKLYLQHRHDQATKCKLLKGYSGVDVDKYSLRPKPEVIFFDCDDCLYFDGWEVAGMLTAKIEKWCTTKKGLPPNEAYNLYKEYGTALKGLVSEGYMNDTEEEKDEFLRYVHDLPISKLIPKDNALREMILNIDSSIPKYVFTASVRHHAERCLKALGIDDLFVDIIDVKRCDYNTKHSRDSFVIAMKVAGVENPEACIFLDDSLTNIKAARSIGWRSVLVGTVGRDSGRKITSEHAEHELDRIHDLPSVLPELFGKQ